MLRHLLVDRRDLTSTRIAEESLRPLADGEARIRIDRVALTANNVTYAAAAHLIPYFEFFPSPENGYGRLPVWGFGDVVASESDALEPGVRLFGIWPASTHVVIQPDRQGRGLVVDRSPHRRDLPPFYANYTPTDEDPTYDGADEGVVSVFRPLFMTAFSIDDWLANEGFFGADRCVLSSASSKTAWATAHRLSMHDTLEVVGCTSPGNVGFVESLGVYDRTLAYEDVSELDGGRPTLFVDFAGSADVRRDVRGASGDALKLDLAVGAAHWSSMGGRQTWAEPAVTSYFAPTTVADRMKELGAGVYMRMYAEAWAGFVTEARASLEFEEHEGIEALRDRYGELAAGEVSPRRGVIIRPA